MEQNPELEANIIWMAARWKAPAGVNPEAELGEYRRILGKHPQPLIRKALERIKEGKPGREWPTPATILEFIPGEDRRSGEPTPELIADLTRMTAKEFQAWHDAQISPAFNSAWHYLRRQDIALRWPLARIAAEEGWIGSLVDYSVQHAEMPGGADLDALKREAQEYRDEIADALDPNMQAIGRMVKLRYQRLAEALGIPRAKARAIYA